MTSSSVGPQPQGTEKTVLRILRKGSVYSISLAIQATVGILVTPLLTRNLASGEYGELTQAIVVVQVFVVLAGAGLPAAITRFYFFGAEGQKNARSLVVTAGLVAVLFSASADALGPIWSGIFPDIAYEPVLRIATWITVPVAITFACQSLLRAQERVGQFVLVGGMASLGAQLFGLGYILFVESSPESYLLGYLIGSIFAAGVGIGLTRPRRQAEKGLVRRGLVFGLPTIPHAIALYLLTAGDRVIVEQQMGLTSVARYHIAYIAGGIGVALLAAFNNAWAPQVYAATDSERWDLLASTTRIVFSIATKIASLLVLVAPLSLAIIAPDSYDLAELLLVVALVALSILPYVFYLAGAHIIFFHGRTAVVAWLTPSVAGFNVALNLWLVPLYGIEGAAIATLASYVVLGGGMLWRSRVLQPIKWSPIEYVSKLPVTVGLILVGVLMPVSVGGLWLRSALASGVAFALFKELAKAKA